MTEERLALAELLEKVGDGDFLRSVAEAVLQMQCVSWSMLSSVNGDGNMIRPAMLAGLATLTLTALSTAPARACAADNDPAELRPCGMPWSTYYEEQNRAVREQYRTPELDADADQGGGRSKRHR